MISVSIWLPLRMPRSVETSKITAWVGICSLIALQEHREACCRRALSANGQPARSPSIGPVLDRKAEHLGEAGLAGAEEAGHPDGDAFVRLVRGLRVALEDLDGSAT